MGRSVSAERKISHHISLTPRATTYVARKARILQVSTAEIVRQMIDREIEREHTADLARDKQRIRPTTTGSEHAVRDK